MSDNQKPSGTPVTERLRRLQLNPIVFLAWAVFFLSLAIAPRFVNAGIDSYIANFTLWICLAQSFNLFTGLTGYVNFGNVVFYGIGGFGVAIATSLWHMPPLIGVLFGGVFSALLALAMSFPTLRLRGAYFAIATLGIEQAVLVLFSNWSYVNKVSGMTIPLSDYHPIQAYYTILVIAAATVITLTIIMKARLGKALSAIRQQEETALSIGVNATLYKTIAFVLSGFFAGLGGAAWIWNVTYIDPSTAFPTEYTLIVIAMAMLGGLGTIFGPAIGAAILDYVEVATRTSYPYLHLIIYGLIIMAVVLVIPDGIVGFAQRLLRRFSFGRAGASPPASTSGPEELAHQTQTSVEEGGH